MASIIVTPIRATIGYDDSKQQWHIKASRQTKENGQFKEWEPFMEKAITLAELLLLLLQFWAMSTGSSTTADPGDLTVFGATLAGGAYAPTLVAAPSLNPNTDNTPTELTGTEYAGESPTLYASPTLYWGATPAPH